MQEQLRLKREDEKRVEDLKKSLYQSTGKAEGAAAMRRDEDKTGEELALEKEMKRRKNLLLAEQRREAGEEKAAAAPDLSQGAAAQDEDAEKAKKPGMLSSKYKE